VKLSLPPSLSHFLFSIFFECLIKFHIMETVPPPMKNYFNFHLIYTPAVSLLFDLFFWWPQTYCGCKEQITENG
jgi:hypothetical protein